MSASESAWRACVDGPDGTNPAWIACGRAYVKREDDSLNAEWKSTYPDLPAASKAALLEEQRSWLAFRDKACRLYEIGDRGREGEVLGFFGCLAQVIRQRTAVLHGYRTDEGQ